MARRPLRVIDVKETIGNSSSGGIYFVQSPTWHVISHTWSADVRAFSTAIGKKLQADVEKRQSYEALFESAALQSHAAYQALVEFLVILQTEGVSWVWFDAVCINQTDTEEKDHEIQHMGTYYQEALGCYTLQHGIGKGFELLLGVDDGIEDGSAAQLPRWFTRAWTLQEWILPPRVTFVLDLASNPHLCMVASFVLVNQGSTCMCCNYATTISPYLVHVCLLQLQASGQDKEKNGLCFPMTRVELWPKRCSKPSDDPHFRKVPGRKQWCFSDDLGYSFLLRLKFILDQMPYMISDEDHKEVRMEAAHHELTIRIGVKQSILQSRIENEARCHYAQVIREITIRDSSNPEDRVLSILKLLGVQNAVQVRTGKSLQAQLCQFAKSLVDSLSQRRARQRLLHMCVVDGFGSETLGMSWMPQFEVQKGSWQEGARALAPLFSDTDLDFPLKKFKFAMRGVAVSDTGVLQFEADVFIGKLVLVPHHQFGKRDDDSKRVYQSANELSRPMVLEVEGQVMSYMYAYMYPESAHPTTCFLASDQYGMDWEASLFNGKVCIAFQAPELDYLRDTITVFLVKIADVMSKRVLCLVCVQERQGNPFHKIGYLNIRKVRLPSSQQMPCCIGGLGRDLNKLVLNPIESISAS